MPSTSKLYRKINSYPLERGIEFSQAYTLTPTRTGTNSAGTFSLQGTAPVYVSNIAPAAGEGSWRFAVNRTSGSTAYNGSSPNTTDLATFSDRDWGLGLWFMVPSIATSQYSYENEIEILSIGGFRISVSSTLWSAPSRIMYSLDGSSYFTWQQTGHTAITAGTWYYVSARRDTSNYYFYINGTLVRTLANTTAITPTSWKFGTTNTMGAGASADMVWYLSNFHYAPLTVINADAISDIYTSGIVAKNAWETGIEAEATAPVFWAKFDETAGNRTAIKSIGTKTFNDANGTRLGDTSGAIITADGKSNNYALFSGNSAGNRTNYTFSDTTAYHLGVDDLNFSVEWWAKVGTVFGSNTGCAISIFGSASDRYVNVTYPGVGMTDAGKVVVQVAGSSTSATVKSSDTKPSDNTWHHYVATYSRATNAFKLYIDGVEDSTTTAPDVGDITNSSVRIGNTGPGTSNTSQFNGAIDEVIIWSQVLTGTDVAEHYATLSAISINYTNTTGATASTTMPMPTVTTTTVINNTYSASVSTASVDIVMPAVSATTVVDLTYSSGPLTSSAEFPAATWSAETVINASYTSGVLGTASAEIVDPTISINVNVDAFGVATASSDTVMPSVSVESNINYSHTVSTASSLMTEATITTTKTVDVSASPLTASALLSANNYYGPTVQDTSYTLLIRQIGLTTNTEGKNGFSIGSTYDDNTLLSKTSLLIRSVSDVPAVGSIIKAKFDPAHVTASSGNDSGVYNTFNIYVFTEAPASWTTFTYANLPAKELISTSRLVDDGSPNQFYLDITKAAQDSRAYTYGIFIEHVATPPYSGTVYDRTEFSGNALDTKLVYILTTEFVNKTLNADPMTASAEYTAASVSVERYVNALVDPSTASSDIVNPSVAVQTSNEYTSGTLTASALFVNPSVSISAAYTSDHLEAFADMLGFTLDITGVINYSAEPATASALFHMPQFDIGENNSSDTMDASALFPMPLVVIPDTNTADVMTSSATMPDVSVTGDLLGLIYAEPMRASSALIDATNFYNSANDPWYVRLNQLHTQYDRSGNRAMLKWFRMTSDISPAARDYNFTESFFETGASIPSGAWLNDRPGFGTTTTYQAGIANKSTNYSTTLGVPKLEVGHLDNQFRKAVRFNNISFTWAPPLNPVGGLPANIGTFTMEMMFKTDKANQFIFGSGPQAVSGTSIANVATRVGLYNGKFFAVTAQGSDPYPKPWDLSTANTGSAFGFKNVADGEWHHLVIQNTGSRLQFWVDGELDFQKLDISIHWPLLLGRHSEDVREDSDFYVSGISVLPNAFISERDIKLNYYAAAGFKSIEAAPMIASANATQNNAGKGNRPRALVLYWWPLAPGGSGSITRQEDLWDGQRTGTTGPGGEFDYRTFYTFDTYNPKIQPFYGWDAYAVDATGYYASEIVKPEAYSGGTRTIINNGQSQVISNRGFRDLKTDNRRYIDIMNDIDLTDVDAIFFMNFPNESNERGEYFEEESVDEYFNIREKILYENFLKSLRNAVDTGIGLMITNSTLAIDLGIVDRVEIVENLMDPWFATNGGDRERVRSVLGEGDAQRVGRWYDKSYNNKFRLVNTLSGLTDKIPFTQKDMLFYEPDGAREFGDPSELYVKGEYHANGLTVGTEWISADLGERRYLGVPFANVKAGRIVAAFGNTYKNGNVTTTNPYANYATHIALQPGDVLQGKQLGGRIWVSFTERVVPETFNGFEVELTTDYWINLALQLSLITQAQANTYLASATNLDRQLARGAITQAEYERRAYWSAWGANQTTEVSSGLQSTVNNEFQAVSKLFEQVFGKEISDSTNIGAFFGYNSSGIIAMVRTYYSEPRLGLPSPTLNTAAFAWLSTRLTTDGTVVRDVAGTSNASMPMPVVTGDKVISVNAQAMISNATIQNPTNIIWTQKDNTYPSLPMLASALMTPRLTLYLATPMTATAAIQQNISALSTQLDEVILYINYVEPIVYLREDIVK